MRPRLRNKKLKLATFSFGVETPSHFALVALGYSIQLYCLGNLYNAKLHNFTISKRGLVGEISLSDVNMHKGHSYTKHTARIQQFLLSDGRC